MNSEEDIVLYRSGSVVSSLLGSFGSSLKETRLTSLLGFLISSDPKKFAQFFKLNHPILEVALESHHRTANESGRSDILLKTSREEIIIEAKVGYHNPVKQVKKYPGTKRIFLTNHIPSTKERNRRNISYFNWQAIANQLKEIAKKKSSHIKFLCNDLVKYLEKYSMIKKTESLEIYAREINDEKTLNLFLKARIYGCYFEKRNKQAESLYFAPHFGESIAKHHPGIFVGISYIAKIENVVVVNSWKEFLEAVKTVRSKAWLNSHHQYLNEIHKHWNWNDKKLRSMLFLGEPRLVFNPPVKKENLQKGKGWLSKRTFSFEELFAGWVK
jgi:hypothetical protein